MPGSDDQDALAVLFTQEYGRLLRTATLLLGDFASGEDVVQEAFIRVSSVVRRQREAVVLRYCDDRSEADTARLMGVSPGAVKGYASRGIATLRERMKETS